ncbi:MAG: FAD-dependent oxidoreductase [Alphaproteobacteria bacterium]|nr:FAD-dependent oxidoreductase [Alphaproteobacteria bacterium]MCB9793601.1 FAD-dependent oxidoreductase [Alphaproteobacteria bacterium]
MTAPDPWQQALLSHVRPADWVNPSPAPRYALVVIGGGPAGLVAAHGAAGLGAKVALVERDRLGGDCLNGGCVPSKALLRAAHAASAAREAAALGVQAQVEVDFEAVMERVRRVQAEIAPHDSAARLRDAGVDVFLGEARFTGPDRLEVAGAELRFARCCLATGARARTPPIPGLVEAGSLHAEGALALREHPGRLVVLGGGVVGCELAQGFAALGVEVELIEQGAQLLPREEPEAAALVQAALERDGVRVRLGASVVRVSQDGARRCLHLADGGRVEADTLLVATGRAPNLDLGLEAAGVALEQGRLRVDEHLRTTNRRIYAAGDVLGQEQLTHAADHHARLVLRNALFPGGARVSALCIPRVTYTRPELASVGLSAAEAEAAPGLCAWRVELGDTDRGRTDGDEGYLRVFADAAGRIRGATVVGPGAGELLAPITLAMTQGLGLGQIAATIHPYPTRSEALFKLASAWQKQRLKPWMPALLSRWFALLR